MVSSLRLSVLKYVQFISAFFISFSYFFEDEEETNEITKSERFAERLKT